jgi:hypothetical protein
MVTKPKLLGCMLAMFAVLSVVPVRMAEAIFVVQPVSATSTFTSADLMPGIDQSGLSPGYTSGTTVFSTYIAGSPTHLNAIGNDAFGTPTTATITFNLGAIVLADALAFWSHGNFSQSLNSIDLVGSADAAFTVPIPLGTFNPTFVNSFTQPVQVFNFTAPASVQYIRFEDMVTNGGGSILFGEVAFSAVPEARAWLMLGVVTVGAMGVYVVRRRAAVPVAAVSKS